MLELQGLFVSLPAAFTDDGSSLSEIRLARAIRRGVESSATGFLVGGDAAEFSALTYTERKHLIELAARIVAPGTPLICNVTSQSTLASIELAQNAAGHGARAAVLAPPMHGDYTDLELVDHYHRVIQYGHIPVIAVDPNKRLDADLKHAIARLPAAYLADPSPSSCFEGTTCDEFASGQLWASPLPLFGTAYRLGPLQALIREHGTARVLKSAEDWIGLELGPLRGPAQPLPRDMMKVLGEAFEQAA